MGPPGGEPGAQLWPHLAPGALSGLPGYGRQHCLGARSDCTRPWKKKFRCHRAAQTLISAL
eukprot:9258592-Pyramimonas_sp.AAC.1